MRSTATIRVDLVSDTPEARDFLLKSIVREVGKFRTASLHDGSYHGRGKVAALIERATLTRIRKR